MWPSNLLITHHPASTLADIQETRRVLRQIPHLAPLRPVDFVLGPGSPIFDGLSDDERARLTPTRCFRLPAAVEPFALEYAV